MTTNSFFSCVNFKDDENFPSGFFHSGAFTSKEAEILSDCGFIMKQLAEGSLKASNEEQEHFLLVVSGKIKPLYALEHIYLKYLNLIRKEKTKKLVNKGLLDEFSIYGNTQQADNLTCSVR